jgi:hypothetical protein
MIERFFGDEATQAWFEPPYGFKEKLHQLKAKKGRLAAGIAIIRNFKL